jgi:hypothetical protein
MKRLLGIVFIFTLLLTSVGLAGAQEPPINTPADNACNEGGVMAGKCGDSEWAWTCGWHLARWLTRGGWSGTYDMPATCAILLPTRPPVIVVEAPASSGPAAPAFPSGNCVFFGGFLHVYVNFNGGFSVPFGATAYSNDQCTLAFTTTAKLIYAPPPFDADALCFAAFGSNAIDTFPNNVYSCF